MESATIPCKLVSCCQLPQTFSAKILYTRWSCWPEELDKDNLLKHLRKGGSNIIHRGRRIATALKNLKSYIKVDEAVKIITVSCLYFILNSSNSPFKERPIQWFYWFPRIVYTTEEYHLLLNNFEKILQNIDDNVMLISTWWYVLVIRLSHEECTLLSIKISCSWFAVKLHVVCGLCSVLVWFIDCRSREISYISLYVFPSCGSEETTGFTIVKFFQIYQSIIKTYFLWP
jgi:hypothetical protein